jgi:hypothetical protein
MLMRIHEILSEARQAPLYHNVSLEKALTIFGNDSMPALWQHNIPGIGRVKGNSFTRNPVFGSNYMVQTGRDPEARRYRKFVARITVDQLKLSHTHRMIPVNADLISHAGLGIPGRNERSKSVPQKRMDEEFVVGDIDNLHQYITTIEILPLGANTRGFNPELARVISAYSEKYKIPLKMDDDTEYWFKMGLHWSEPEYAAKPHPDKTETDQMWNQQFGTPVASKKAAQL